jgi:hypothetical protein
MRDVVKTPVLLVGVALACTAAAAAGARDDALNEAQRAYVQWTQKQFASHIDQAEYADLSASTKQELTQMWVKMLRDERSWKRYEAVNGLAVLGTRRR